MTEVSQVYQAGKVAAALLDSAVLPFLGAHRLQVLIGPKNGADTGVIDLGGDQVLSLTTDPFFVMRELGWDRAAWFAVHIVASDAATSGLRPAYLAIDLNLPLDMPDADIRDLWEAVHIASRDLDIAIVTGHTGRYDGCSFPMLGGATIFSVGSKHEYISSSMARPGDAVLLTKGAAIETTAMFGTTLPELLRSRLGDAVAREAHDLFHSMTVVPDAMAAIQAGVRENGVTAMHDATERGVLGALVELAESAGAGVSIDRDAIPVRAATRAICDLFDIDPYSASSEGTLLIACRAHRTGAVLESLETAGILGVQIGELTPADEGCRATIGGIETSMSMPEFDPFWPAYVKALEWQP